jgi:hypothetical protein
MIEMFKALKFVGLVALTMVGINLVGNLIAMVYMAVTLGQLGL